MVLDWGATIQIRKGIRNKVGVGISTIGKGVGLASQSGVSNGQSIGN